MGMEGAKRLKDREDKEKEMRLKQAKDFALEQKKQLAEYHAREEARKEEEREIGRRALALAKKVKLEAEEAQTEKLRMIAAKNVHRVHDNERLEKYKKKLRKKEALEMKKIEDYAKMKEKQ